MQIKRFEADDMNQALRLVKREFGDDAVILSAKEIRSSGILKAIRKKRIVVTAAMGTTVKPDTAISDLIPPSQDRTEDRETVPFTGLLSKALQSENDIPKERVSLSTRSSVSMPIAGSGSLSGDLPKPAGSVKTPSAPAFSADSAFQTHRLISALRQYGKKRPATSDAAICHDIDKRQNTDPVRSDGPKPSSIEKPFYQIDRPQHRIAVVGPSGAGKSSMVVKLAWYCQAVEKKKTAVITLDRYRIGANGFLDSAARIMNLSVARARSLDELSQALDNFSDYPVVLIDTPGMGSQDHAVQDNVRSLLQAATPHEVHLVINATIRRRVIADAIDTFSSFGVNRLMLTHLDEYESRGNVPAELYPTTQLPTVFCGTGVDLFDGFQVTCPNTAASGRPRFFSMETVASCEKSAASRSRTPASPLSPPHDGTRSERYVANRKTGLFHHPTCRFAKWGSDADQVSFHSMAQAVGSGFDPCQGCCTVGVIRKSSSPQSLVNTHRYANVFP